MNKAIIAIIMGALCIVESVLILIGKGDWLFTIGGKTVDPNQVDMKKLTKISGIGFGIAGIIVVIAGILWNNGNSMAKWIIIAAAVLYIAVYAYAAKVSKK